MTLRMRCLAPLLLVLPLLGQVAARQGTVADVQPSEFSSPMVLELAMDKLKTGELVDLYSFTGLEKFVCDDASLPLVVIRKTINPSAKRVELKIESTVYVRPSYDRKVNLRYSIISAGKALPAVTEHQVSAKERKYRSDSSTLILTKDEFDNLFQDDHHGVLKVVMTVLPDR